MVCRALVTCVLEASKVAKLSSYLTTVTITIKPIV